LTEFTEGDRKQINDIASAVAVMRGQLDQYLKDQGRRCAAHDRAMELINLRVDGIEEQVEANRVEIRMEKVTKAFIWKTMTALVAITGVVIKLIDWASRRGNVAG
jgi:hypothetical protein